MNYFQMTTYFLNLTIKKKKTKSGFCLVTLNIFKYMNMIIHYVQSMLCFLRLYKNINIKLLI